MIAGEASGDLHGAKLIENLKHLAKSPVEIYGVGGDKIRQTGALNFFDLAHFHATGFTDAIQKIPRYQKALSRILKDIRSAKPDLVVLIDNPGFNFRLAEKIHALGIPVVYYIAPQLWAWAKNRVFQMKKWARKVLVVFDFEKALYEKHGIPVAFVGHPLKDLIPDVKVKGDRALFESKRALSPFTLSPFTISLLPGSRKGELKMLLSVFLDAAERIQEKFPRASFQLIQAPTMPREIFDRAIAGRPLSVRLVDKNSYDAIGASDLAIVCSGTATLECALLKVPMIISYKTSFLTYVAAKSVIKVPYLGMPNLILGEKKFPELLQVDATPQKIADEAIAILSDRKLRERMKQDLEEVSRRLGEPGASVRAAQEILMEKY